MNLTKKLEERQSLLQTEELNLDKAQRAVERLKWQIAFIRDLIDEIPEAAQKKPAENGAKGDEHLLLMAGGTTPNWVRKVLEENHGPLRVRDIVEKIVASGMAGDIAKNEVELKRLADNVSSAVNRKSPRSPFVKTGRGTFDLRLRAKS